MGSDKDIIKPVSGELIRVEDDDGAPVVRTLFARLSRLPFKNFWQRKKISSMKEVIKEEKEFAEIFEGHQRSVNRLAKIRTILRQDDAEIEGGAIAAENRLAALRREAEAREIDDLLFKQKKAFECGQSGMQKEYELKIQEAGYKKRLHALEKEVAELEAKEKAQPKKKTVGRQVAEEMKKAAQIEEALDKAKQKYAGKGFSKEAEERLEKRRRILGEEMKE